VFPEGMHPPFSKLIAKTLSRLLKWVFVRLQKRKKKKSKKEGKHNLKEVLFL